MKAFYIDAQALNRLDEFHDLSETLRQVVKIVEDLFHTGNKIKVSAKRLKQLINFKTVVRKADEDTEMKGEESDADENSNDGIFPDYVPILDEFAGMITWKTFGGKKIPEPKLGIDPNYDDSNKSVESIKKQMSDYVKDAEKDIGS